MPSIRRDLLLILLATATLFGVALGARDLWNPNEPVYGQAVAEMAARGDWLLPTVNGHDFGENFGGPIGRPVVHNHDFPADLADDCLEPGKNGTDRVLLVEARNNNGDGWREVFNASLLQWPLHSNRRSRRTPGAYHCLTVS